MSRRAFVVVIDACGAGALPDSASYGDAGANTLLHLAQARGGLELPTLQALGLGNILELPGVAPSTDPVLHGRLHPLGPGKDSTTGHWELMGAAVAAAPPSYPQGPPAELIELIERTIGRRPLCARAYDGLAAIADFGAEHMRSGRPILYTSQDSVLQLAAHVDVIAPDELYAAAAALRGELDSPDAVRRVIARPFEGEPGAFERTLGRRDYTRPPPGPTYLDQLRAAGVEVHGVGKAAALFDGAGFSAVHPGASNAEAIASIEALIGELDAGLVFANLIETDQRYGHRHDVEGFHGALQVIDAALARWLAETDPRRDLLILTADHGCDPLSAHTDHTREHVPLLASFAGHGGRRHDGPLADAGASAYTWLLGASPAPPGRSFIDGA